MRSRGQASVDYVAALALLAVVFALGATAVAAPWLPASLADAIRRGVCVVSGSLCTPAQARAAGLEPCPIHRRSEAERGGVTALVQLGRSDAMVVERRSDGTVSVAFVDGGRVGAELGIGLRLAAQGADAQAAAGVVFNRGRLYDFTSWPAAQRFLARFARQETMTGEGRRALRGLCPSCPDWVGGHADDLPEPDARFTEAGGYGELSAGAGLETGGVGDGASLDATLASRGVALVGRRRRGGRSTWYLRVGNEVAAELGAVLGSMAGATEAGTVLELHYEGGRPVLARVATAAALAAQVELAGSSLDTGEVVDRLTGALPRPGGPEATGGMAVEASVSLDLTDPANLQAVRAVLLPDTTRLQWAMRLRALGRRLDVDGTVDVATFRSTRSEDEHDYSVGQGASFGVGYGITRTTRELLTAWSGRPAALRRREDCERPGAFGLLSTQSAEASDG